MGALASTCGHIEVCHETQGAVADVLKLYALDETRANSFRLKEAFECLHSRLLIGANHVCAFGGELRSSQIRVTDLLHVDLILLRVLALVLRRQPVL